MANNPVNGIDRDGNIVILLNKTFIAQIAGVKYEITISYALAYDPKTGNASISKLYTTAPGLGVGKGSSAGLSVSIYPTLNSTDMVTGTALNVGAYGGLLGSVSFEVHGPDIYEDIFPDPPQGINLGFGVGVGVGGYVDISQTVKVWELTFDELNGYINSPDAAAMDFLNYFIYKSPDLMLLRPIIPMQIRNIVKPSSIEVGPIIGGEDLKKFYGDGN